MKKPNGGQAFPYMDEPGMTLRDYFAGQALVGIAFAMGTEARRRYREGVAEGQETVVAYALADAMLAEREK